MRLKTFLSSFAAAALTIAAAADAAPAPKKVLGHEDFDAWKSVRNHSISRNGEWSAYSVNPQEGGDIWFTATTERKSAGTT